MCKSPEVDVSREVFEDQQEGQGNWLEANKGQKYRKCNKDVKGSGEHIL